MAVKILKVERQHLLKKDPKFPAKERFIQEAYHTWRLNEDQHQNFPVLLGFNTESFPYHIITKYESCGCLLELVRKSRKEIPKVKSTQLLKMLIGISDALLHLEKLNLVHRAIMAENVLVGDNFVCKLSGLHALEQLTTGPSNGGNVGPK